LTFIWQVAIVRRFREYPGHVVGETQRVKGRKQALAIADGSSQDRNPQIALHWIQEIHRRISLISDQDVASLRPIAIVPATPSTRMGYAGRNSETESAHPFDSRKDARPPSTVYVWLVVLIYRRGREDLRQETRQRSHFFACTAKSEARTLLCVSHKFGCHVSRALTRSSSAYVPSARQAGPHAHSL
jgi:hypothetical protein